MKNGAYQVKTTTGTGSTFMKADDAAKLAGKQSAAQLGQMAGGVALIAAAIAVVAGTITWGNDVTEVVGMDTTVSSETISPLIKPSLIKPTSGGGTDCIGIELTVVVLDSNGNETSEVVNMRINTLRLRALIGWLGMLLPWIVVLLIGYIPNSISATWYTNACTVFMIILGSASILLISYKGYEMIDDIVLTSSGIFGLGICLFPCAVSTYPGKVGTFLIDRSMSNTIHFVCAIAFFGLLAYNSFFLFTKSSGELTRKKKIRNIIYRVCGVGMVTSFGIMLFPYFPCRTWVTETFALFFFGISFLTKADIYPWLFCDTPYKEGEDG
jgi:hypothetical protein